MSSASSGDSDLEDIEDQVDGRYDKSRNNVTATGYRSINTDKASPLRHHHHRSSSSHASSTRTHSSKSHTAPIPGLVVDNGLEVHQQGSFLTKNNNTPHSGTATDNIYHRFMSNR